MHRSVGEIHNCVAQLRKKREVTQQECADVVGVTRQTIIAIEKGNYTPSVSLAIKIARYFNKPVEKVFSLHNI